MSLDYQKALARINSKSGDYRDALIEKCARDFGRAEAAVRSDADRLIISDPAAKRQEAWDKFLATQPRALELWAEVSAC